MQTPGWLVILLITLVLAAGCATNPAKSSFSVDDKGALSLTCAPETVSATVLFSNETYTKSRLVFHAENEDVIGYLAVPAKMKGAVVYAPGAGEKLAGHEARMVRYAAAGYGFLFVDTRGNGGETPGIPFGQQLVQQDFATFEKGEMPQYYQSICDLTSARRYLAANNAVPIYAMGSSNGGRYAAVAVGTDPLFSGYVGISTSDWGLLDSVTGQGIGGDPLRFAMSLEPSSYFSRISPRPVWIFHARADPIIPFESGQQFFEKALEPKKFIEFSGAHGINPDVDTKILEQWA